MIERKGEFSMKKNIITVLLVLIVPIIGYILLNNSNSDVVGMADAKAAKPQVIKFTSAMCLDCQEMNKLMKEVYPEFKEKIALIEIPVQDGKAFTQEQIKKYNVTLVPTIIMLDSDGKQVKRIEGAIPREELVQYLEGLK